MSREQLPPAGCDRMIGSSARCQMVYDLVRRVANLDASVLITGESGTGKELIAQAIHNLGHRKERPFVAVSCGAIPQTLIEAELFGAEKGRIYGSANRRRGYLEEAGNGTLFFDEIGRIQRATQVKLLRVLQEREFSRLGSGQVIPLQARLLFATTEICLRWWRKGLFARISITGVNVMGIKSPRPARPHGRYPAIVTHFLDKYSGPSGKSMTGITPSAMALLLQYEWPGNVRELENVIQGAIILATTTAFSRRSTAAMQHPDFWGWGTLCPELPSKNNCRITKSSWRIRPSRNARATRRWQRAVFTFRGRICIA